MGVSPLNFGSLPDFGKEPVRQARVRLPLLGVFRLSSAQMEHSPREVVPAGLGHGLEPSYCMRAAASRSSSSLRS